MGGINGKYGCLEPGIVRVRGHAGVGLRMYEVYVVYLEKCFYPLCPYQRTV